MILTYEFIQLFLNVTGSHRLIPRPVGKPRTVHLSGYGSAPVSTLTLVVGARGTSLVFSKTLELIFHDVEIKETNGAPRGSGAGRGSSAGIFN